MNLYAVVFKDELAAGRAVVLFDQETPGSAVAAYAVAQAADPAETEAALLERIKTTYPAAWLAHDDDTDSVYVMTFPMPAKPRPKAAVQQPEPAPEAAPELLQEMASVTEAAAEPVVAESAVAFQAPEQQQTPPENEPEPAASPSAAPRKGKVVWLVVQKKAVQGVVVSRRFGSNHELLTYVVEAAGKTYNRQPAEVYPSQEEALGHTDQEISSRLFFVLMHRYKHKGEMHDDFMAREDFPLLIERARKAKPEYKDFELTVRIMGADETGKDQVREELPYQEFMRQYRYRFFPYTPAQVQEQDLTKARPGRKPKAGV